MKIFTFCLIGIALSSAGIVKAQSTCADKIDTAQKCVKQCLTIESLGLDSSGFQYGNLLLQCLDDIGTSDIANQIGNCCGMDSYDDATCGTAMQEADSCLKGELSKVSTTAEDYLVCIYNRRIDGSCPFAAFCVAILVGGYGTTAVNDFSVGSESSLANMTSNAKTCDDMNIFGENVCTNVEGCCEPCANKIAAVVNAVVDDLLLPSYGNSTLQNCGGNKTCADYTDSSRLLESIEESSPEASTIIDVINALNATELADQCIDGLAGDLVLYNKTFAVSNLFVCISKKMDEIIVEADVAAIDSMESSGSPIFFGAVATALSTIVSAFYAIVL